MIVKSAEDLRELVQSVLAAAGASRENAVTVAEHLVLANLSGVDTHGVWHVGGYVSDIKSGNIVPTAAPSIAKETDVSALVNGNLTFGQVSARFAMELAIGKAQDRGMSVVSLVNSHHIGRLGHYSEMAAAAGLLAQVWAGGFSEVSPAAVPFGGRQRLLHTNPLSMGFPTGDGTPVGFDFATTALSGVKVDNARKRGEQLPTGCVVDKQGNPTTDPNAFFDGGAHVPFGGHKGYCLMMACEFLGRIFGASDAYVEADKGNPVMRHQGTTFLAIRADLFQPMADYTARADEMVERTRAVPPAPGFDAVLAPGDPEANHRAARSQEGIPIHEDIWKTVVETAELVGVAVPD